MSKHYLRKFHVIFGIVSLWLIGWVGGLDTRGRDFVIGAVTNANASVSNITLIITSEELNNGTIFSQTTGTISIPPFNGSTIIVLPGNLIPDKQGVGNYGIRVRTRHLASVQAFVNNSIENGSEGTIVFPFEALGAEYLVNGETPNGAFTIVAPRDLTKVSITFRNGTQSRFTLEKTLDSLSFSGPELDGSMIGANQEIALFVGRDCSVTPDPDYRNPSVCGYLWEQIVHTNHFGSDFILVNPNAPLETSSENRTITTLRLVSITWVSWVLVSIPGLTEPYPIRLVPQQAVAIETTNLTNVISATAPIDVQIITQSLDFENQTQWSLIPNNRFVSEAWFFVDSSTNNQLSLVARTSDVTKSGQSLTFNGVPFDLSLFKPSANPSYSFVITEPKQGTNLMSATFKLGGYLSGSKPNATNFGSIIGRSFS